MVDINKRPLGPFQLRLLATLPTAVGVRSRDILDMLDERPTAGRCAQLSQALAALAKRGLVVAEQPRRALPGSGKVYRKSSK